MKPTLILTLVLLSAGGCNDSGGSIVVPTNGGGPPSIGSDRETANYLWEAVDSLDFFRWTPIDGWGYPYVEFWVDDVNVPEGFDPIQARIQLSHAIGSWKSTLEDAASPIMTMTRWASDNPEFYGVSDLVVFVEYIEAYPPYSSMLGGTDFAGSSGTIDRVEMTLALRSSGTGLLLPDEVAVAVALHEVGHVLGIVGFAPLSGHSSDERDVMFPQIIGNWRDLSRGDSLAIQELYSTWPTLVRSDG